MPLSQIYQATVVLDNDQILHLPSQPIEIIPAPGITKFIVPFHYVVMSKVVGGLVYTNLTVTPPFWNNCALLFTYGDDDNDASTYLPAFMGSAGTRVGWATAPANVTTEVTPWVVAASPLAFADKPIKILIRNDDGDLTGGGVDNTLTVNAFYTIIDV